MNGVHDMGGMHGMGPIKYEKDEPVFHEPLASADIRAQPCGEGLAHHGSPTPLVTC